MNVLDLIVICLLILYLIVLHISLLIRPVTEETKQYYVLCMLCWVIITAYYVWRSICSCAFCIAGWW